MNQVFAGATAVILTLVLWSFGKKPKAGFSAKINPKAIGELQQHEISLIHKTNISSFKATNPHFCDENNWQPPQSIKDRKILNDHLRKLISGSPEERLNAITIAKNWKSADVIPILKRGLRDSDSRVVVAAASAIQKYRGTSKSTIN